MIRDWFKRNQIVAISILVLFLGMVIGWFMYLNYGHQLVGNILVDVLNRINKGQTNFSLDYYFERTDRAVLFYVIFIPFTFAFFFLLTKLYGYFLKLINMVIIKNKEEEKYIRNDLLVAFALYTVCTMLFFYPCFRFIDSYIIGPPSDNMMNLWNMWWANKTITDHNISLTFSNYIFYPQGTSLLFQTYSFYNIFLSIILRQFLNPIMSYNLLILHSFVLAGIGAFLLIKYLVRDSYLAFIGGFIFAFNPSHFIHSLYHINISSIQFIPFFVLFFIKFIRNNSKKYLFLSALFFLMNTLCCWYYFVLSIYFMVFSYIYLAYKRKQIILRDILAKMVIIIGITVSILSLWLWKMILFGIKHPEVNHGWHDVFTADMFALFTPSVFHTLGNLKIVESMNLKFTGNPIEATTYLGIISILIIIFNFKRIKNEAAKYFCGFFVFLILAMGPSIHILGKIIPVMLPYEVVKYIPFLKNMRCPSRIIVYVYLFLAVIVALGLKSLLNSYKTKIKKNFFLILLILLLFFDYYSVCKAMAKVHLPHCYRAINNEKEIFGILDLPSGPYVNRSLYMMYQIYHGFPIAQGAVARKTGTALIDYLDIKDFDNQKKQLLENKVKYIVIHKKLITPFITEWYPVNITQYKENYKAIYEDEENIVLQVY